MAKPRVSVVMATYNRPRELFFAVQSIAEQTYQDWELVVVDDGSTDETPNILSTTKDERVRIIRLPNNSGPMVAFYTGINASRGESIILHDGDDVSMPDRIEKIVNNLPRGKALYHAYYQVSRHPEIGKMMRKYFPAKPFDKKLICTSHYIPGPLLSFDASLKGKIKNHPGVRFYWDWTVILDLVDAGVGFVALDIGLYEYWRRGSGVSFTENPTKEALWVRGYAKSILEKMEG